MNKTEKEKVEVLDALRGMVFDLCDSEKIEDSRIFDSGFHSCSAHAMRILAKHGWFEITTDNSGRLVEGKLVGKEWNE